ncbi:Tellurite resistance protein TehA [Nitrosomonas sp. Nm51]|uniref:tellurite resistance/C4-dicarboxylate transporter family protein n=1 Tax=Nitrosomonas sp. Nm51 TaxID=133720 RepID=UPI0008B9E0E4|nr:tellurite resistance/C4-dicarboxylate transporter family protein [Nitrosomonas sp. Nm51]SER61989.1 Tellurite resistance protein TehA [Nitrosomonas sp. Nm51]
MDLTLWPVQDAIKNSNPAYFAMVMATGIVSIALDALDLSAIAQSLFILNLVFYAVLCAILLIRIVFFMPTVIAELGVLRRSLLFLTFVVGTNTVGMQLVVFLNVAPVAVFVAVLLWFVALTGWLVGMRFILRNLFIMPKNNLPDMIDGTGLLIAVSTASISLLGVGLMDALNLFNTFALCIAAGFWLLGVASYIVVIGILVYHLFFGAFQVDNWEAPYWICMGAVAIITLAGSKLVLLDPPLSDWENLREIVLGMTAAAGMIATAWIPYLAYMDYRKFTHTGSAEPAPLWIRLFPWLRLAFGKTGHAYVPTAWSRVFPMGMYAAGLVALMQASGFDFAGTLARHWIGFAWLVWLLTLIGMLRALYAFIRRWCALT